MFNLDAFQNKPKRNVTVSFDRSGEYDEIPVLLVQSVKNSVKIPKGASRTILGVEAGVDGVAIVPNFFNAQLTMETLTAMNPELAAKIKEAGQVIVGADLVAKLESGEIQELMADEPKAELIASINPEEDYPIVTLIFKKEDKGEITLEEYNKLSKAEKKGYNLRKKEERATIDGMVGKEGTFSCAAAYSELGGTDAVFADEACTEEVELNVEETQYNKQLVFSISEGMDFGDGNLMSVAYLTKVNCRESQKGMNKKEETADVKAEATNEDVTEQADVVAENNSDEAPTI